MSNSKAAGTLTMGFNGKMSLALAKDIEATKNERDPRNDGAGFSA